MSKKMASIILAYGLTLAALSLLIQPFAPAFAKTILITGAAGGGLCVLWSIVALKGHQRRTWAVLTTIAVAFVTLSQAVQAWLAFSEAASTSLTGRLVVTLMFLMTVGMLLYLLHGERPPDFYNMGAARRDPSTSRGDDARSETRRHQLK